MTIVRLVPVAWLSNCAWTRLRVLQPEKER